jgi:hypothetical protein
LQAKPRKVRGAKRRSGQPERFNEAIFGQELAEMVGQIMAQLPLWSFKDQEAFVLTMHGTQFRLCVAYFDEDYIRYLKTSAS